jgi:hypothetical protein
MTVYHKNTQHTWHTKSLMEQMANIGAEVGRSIKWRSKGKEEMSKKAFYRALELFDFTIADAKNRDRLREIVRARGFFVDYYMGDNISNSTAESWDRYFLPFAVAARR